MQIQRYRKFGGSDMVKFLKEVSKPVYSLDVHTETKGLIESMKERFDEKKSERGLRPNNMFVAPTLPDNFDVGNFMKRWHECVSKGPILYQNSEKSDIEIEIVPLIYGTGGEIDNYTNPFELNYDTLFANGITDEALERWGRYTRNRCKRFVSNKIYFEKWFGTYRNTGVMVTDSMREKRSSMMEYPRTPDEAFYLSE